MQHNVYTIMRLLIIQKELGMVSPELPHGATMYLECPYSWLLTL